MELDVNQEILDNIEENGNGNGDMDLLSKYPININAINKGDHISAQTVEQVTGEKVGTQEFVFAKLSLGEWIQKMMWNNRQVSVVVRYPKDGISILTDSEAIGVLSARNDQACKAIRKQAMQITRVDSSRLSASERIEKDRVQMKICFRKQMVNKRVPP